jgi:hypothetical protein
MSYSKNFIRDVRWYLKMRHQFNFDGKNNYTTKWVDRYTARTDSKDKPVFTERLSFDTFKDRFPQMCSDNGVYQYAPGEITTHIFNLVSEQQIVYDKDGVDGVEAFHSIDSIGKSIPTRHPNILKTLLKTKGSVNLHIKMYAQSMGEGTINKIEFRAWCIYCWQSPDWFRTAVETQKWKYDRLI